MSRDAAAVLAPARRTTLSEAVESEGFNFVIDPRPWERPDIVGNPPVPENRRVLLCSKGTLVATCDDWDLAYDASHEIAEARCGHNHTAEMFCHQANILATWIRWLGIEQAQR